MPHTSRSLYSLRSRLAFVLLVTAFCHQQHLFFVSRQSLAAKYSETVFEVTNPGLHPRSEGLDDEDTGLKDELIANREKWEVLGEGWEGKVFAYKESVIKTFTPGRSPFRNCASGATNEKWPTEIAASLRFGGFEQELNDGDAGNTGFEGFLPVRAYFKALLSPAEDPQWHLVTPLVEDGNLKDLAERLALDANGMSAAEIDEHYRPAFEHLLQHLQTFHEAQYCHDDIKPANIFIQDDTKWLLGDLGNVRHISHAYHSSRLWEDNKQLSDCRANDVMRALKSYLQFVRAASHNYQQFDVEFFRREEPLSRLFWAASADASDMSAAKLQYLSAVEYTQRPSAPQTNQQMAEITQLSKHQGLQKAVDNALETRMGEKLARWWGMVGIFGVPESKTCGF